MKKKFKKRTRDPARNWIKRTVSRNRSGLSPIITTVLLIALTLVITSVVFLWFRGMVEESITKFNPPKNIKLVCDDVNFDSDYSSGVISIVNNGDVPIYSLDIKISKDGNYQTKELKQMTGASNWPQTGLLSGGTFSANIANDPAMVNADSILISPVLRGTSNQGQRSFTCGGQYGQEISV